MHAKKARPSIVTEPHHKGLVEDLFKLIHPQLTREVGGNILPAPVEGQALAPAGALPQRFVADGGPEYISWGSL
jgi:hypothetical protein